jgi:S1-C subfamily serine protease
MCFHSLLVWSFVWQAAPRYLCQGGLSLSQSTSGTTLIGHSTHIVNCDWFLLKVPEGNGSGFIWDAEGHIVTNYHVIGSSLARNPSPGKLVARVTLLGADG